MRRFAIKDINGRTLGTGVQGDYGAYVDWRPDASESDQTPVMAALKARKPIPGCVWLEPDAWQDGSDGRAVQDGSKEYLAEYERGAKDRVIIGKTDASVADGRSLPGES